MAIVLLSYFCPKGRYRKMRDEIYEVRHRRRTRDDSDRYNGIFSTSKINPHEGISNRIIQC